MMPESSRVSDARVMRTIHACSCGFVRIVSKAWVAVKVSVSVAWYISLTQTLLETPGFLKTGVPDTPGDKMRLAPGTLPQKIQFFGWQPGGTVRKAVRWFC